MLFAVTIQFFKNSELCCLRLLSIYPRGALNFGLRAMCHRKDPTFFRSLSPKDPHFYKFSPNGLLFLTNSLSPEDPDTSLSLKDFSFPYLLVKLVTIFRQKFGFLTISTNLTKSWEIFGHFGSESPYFFDAFHWKKTLLLCALSLKDSFFDAICHRKTPTSEVLGGTRTSLSYVSAPRAFT